MDIFIWHPDIDNESETEPSVNVTKFGDGYELRVPDGINTEKTSWSLTFSRVSEETREILAFLRKQAGVKAFQWTTPDGEKVVCVCRKWRKVRHAGFGEISCTFERVYEY